MRNYEQILVNPLAGGEIELYLHGYRKVEQKMILSLDDAIELRTMLTEAIVEVKEG